MDQEGLEIQFNQLSIEDQDEAELKKKFKKLQKLDTLAKEYCCVCLQLQLIHNNFCIIEPCSHRGCQQCIKHLIENYDSKCPLCRAQIHEIRPVYIFDDKIVKGAFSITVTPLQVGNYNLDQFQSQTSILSQSFASFTISGQGQDRQSEQSGLIGLIENENYILDCDSSNCSYWNSQYENFVLNKNISDNVGYCPFYNK